LSFTDTPTHAAAGHSAPASAAASAKTARFAFRGSPATRRHLATAFTLLIIAALLFLFISPDYRQGEASLNGHPAKDFAFTYNGRPAHLSDFRGKVVVLNFWATWCPPCVEETPSLNDLQARIANQGGTILGVSVDDDPQAYQAFLKDNGVMFPTYRDDSRTIAAEYGTSRFPETYLIDRKGRIARKIIGSQDWANGDILLYIQSLLAQH
jgi:cytochrome c biogenesis protein CcmG, thiol:disulfide interchange protein DsbE